MSYFYYTSRCFVNFFSKIIWRSIIVGSNQRVMQKPKKICLLQIYKLNLDWTIRSINIFFYNRFIKNLIEFAIITLPSGKFSTFVYFPGNKRIFHCKIFKLVHFQKKQNRHIRQIKESSLHNSFFWSYNIYLYNANKQTPLY